ncbi:hypothetical protein BX661DRAFT_171533 [Kickxella alabastrina]|uniref:uncharacterized protein n=1 Tax=Kickxella alabastrina TaxID=61397 RepID=UPI0022210A51|nr:uncharacterized protein BX661DRAFT_171533 [Kickxella alabastrina]KAI7826248.1 hypothetical protein BX661DRAFT_171533 [Kickxella alabastrina]
MELAHSPLHCCHIWRSIMLERFCSEITLDINIGRERSGLRFMFWPQTVGAPHFATNHLWLACVTSIKHDGHDPMLWVSSQFARTEHPAFARTINRFDDHAGNLVYTNPAGAIVYPVLEKLSTFGYQMSPRFLEIPELSQVVLFSNSREEFTLGVIKAVKSLIHSLELFENHPKNVFIYSLDRYKWTSNIRFLNVEYIDFNFIQLIDLLKTLPVLQMLRRGLCSPRKVFYEDD